MEEKYVEETTFCNKENLSTGSALHKPCITFPDRRNSWHARVHVQDMMLMVKQIGSLSSDLRTLNPFSRLLTIPFLQIWKEDHVSERFCLLRLSRNQLLSKHSPSLTTFKAFSTNLSRKRVQMIKVIMIEQHRPVTFKRLLTKHQSCRLRCIFLIVGDEGLTNALVDNEVFAALVW